MDKEKTLYRILDISPGSKWLILFCLPPLYFIYFIAVGNYLLEKTGKKNLVFQVATTYVLLLFCLMILGNLLVPEKLIAIEKTFQRGLALTGVLSWFISMFILTYITVKFERSLQVEKHFTFSDNADYVKRFFCFGYFPLTIWSFQHLANEYRKPKENLIERG